MARRTFSMGGIHPGDSKISRECKIEKLAVPPVVYISLSQHIGAPAKPVVAVGDKVKVGQVIGEPGGFMSAYIHSSVSGTVKSIKDTLDQAGKAQPTVEIAVEGDEWLESIDRSDALVADIPADGKAILEKIKLGGIVGLGGATFPTHVKLSPPPGKTCEMLIINGCECEPYITADDRTLRERGAEVVVGAALIKHVLGVAKATIAIEDNKPEAIQNIQKVLSELRGKDPEYAGIEVLPLMKKYPEGGEKQLIDAVMHRQVKSGGLPIDVGAVVQNVATALAVYEAVQKNKPLFENSITVSGECFPHQANVLVRVGTPLRFIIDQLGGVPENAAKIISGGPMMGKAISNLDGPTLKGTGSILFLTREQTKREPEGHCIRCGKCADACPMGLEPFLLYRLYKAGDSAALERNAAQDCIQCGCCLYTCPANLPLLDIISLARGQVMGILKARAVAAKAAAEAAKAKAEADKAKTE